LGKDDLLTVFAEKHKGGIKWGAFGSIWLAGFKGTPFLGRKLVLRDLVRRDALSRSQMNATPRAEE
jgi:hypothetical protein